MARTVADINRACTPMHVIEESLDESREQLREKKKKLEAAQKSKSPFLVGSIEEVNRRISNLDQKLQTYTELVIESRASERSDEVYIPPPSAKIREAHQRKAFLVKPSERVKNISKISMQPSKTNVKKDTGKPKFVELHQYPGYEASELTPLPHDVSAIEALTKAANAQPKLKHLSQYKPEFERLFFSQMSQAVLQDIFWWLFLEKWQPEKESQQKLFNRVAHNYVKLMTYAKHPVYRETFLSDYPSMLTQAVYAAYCHSFPDSYRMFGEEFKEDLIGLVYEWVTGCRAAPRVWLTWDFAQLEPAGLKQREKLIKQAKAKKSSTLNLDFIDLLTSSQFTGSQSTLNQISSNSSMSSFGGNTARSPRKSKKTVKHSRPGPSNISVRTDMTAAIHEVADAQKENNSETNGLKADTNKRIMKSSSSLANSKETDTKNKVGISGGEALTPIHEFDEEKEKNPQDIPKESKVSFMLQTPRSAQKESHPVGKGPTFSKAAFNTYGKSPLVAHFLRMRNLQIEAGLHARVQRTEVGNLPPIDAPTYRDLIQDSFKKVNETGKKYDKLVEKDKLEAQKFVHKQKRQYSEHKKREALLLSNRREVKKIADLIMLEMKKDQDSIGAGVGLAIDAALASMEC